MQTLFQSQWFRTFGPALAGFLAYGGWAFFCNYQTSLNAGFKAGLVQGSFSFLITIFFNGVMEYLYARWKSRYLISILCSGSLVMTSFSINWLAGTPNILPTIAPGALLGSIYVFGYVKGLESLFIKAGEKSSNTLPLSDQTTGQKP